MLLFLRQFMFVITAAHHEAQCPVIVEAPIRLQNKHPDVSKLWYEDRSRIFILPHARPEYVCGNTQKFSHIFHRIFQTIWFKKIDFQYTASPDPG